MIDLHCHLLPGVDDGPKTMDEAVQLARACADNGITHAVVTPHFVAGRWENTRSSISKELATFQEALRQAEIKLSLSPGGEVHLMPETLTLLANDEMPFIGGWGAKRVVLLELPDGGIPVGAIQAVDFLLEQHVVPMIAHPERNKDVMRSIHRMTPFVERGCILQLTAASVCGKFGQPAYKAAHELLAADAATVVATDTHNLANRPPMLAQAHEVLTDQYGGSVADELTINNPRRIVNARVALGLAP